MSKELEKSLLGIGIGVSGGALTGRAVYSEKEIEHFRQKEPETALILIRPDTVPDDVGIILKVDGLLTARGGGTSHAAVTIPQLNKVGVVGFNKLHVYESEGYSMVDGKTIKEGDFIGIDGWSGAVYTGKHAIDSDESYKITHLNLSYLSQTNFYVRKQLNHPSCLCSCHIHYRTSRIFLREQRVFSIVFFDSDFLSASGKSGTWERSTSINAVLV